MTVFNYLPFFVIGLLGAAHCAGMCGGIAGALSLAGPLQIAAYNAGRIASYMTAGAIAGGMVDGIQALSTMASLQMVGYWLVNLMLLALGLRLMSNGSGFWSRFAVVEQAGSIVWRRVQPFMRLLLPVDSPVKALALGALWGWVPCGMVYSVLLTAMLTGSWWNGAMIMLSFGLGTLPAMLTIGVTGARLRSWIKVRGIRIAGGLIVLAFGALGLMRAAGGMLPAWQDVLCITPPAGSLK